MSLLTYPIEHPYWFSAALLLTIPLYHIIAWWKDEHGIRDIPGPKLAVLSDAWLGYWASQGVRSFMVHDVHKEFGKLRFKTILMFVLSLRKANSSVLHQTTYLLAILTLSKLSTVMELVQLR